MNRYKYENRIFYASNIIVDNSYQYWFKTRLISQTVSAMLF